MHGSDLNVRYSDLNAWYSDLNIRYSDLNAWYGMKMNLLKLRKTWREGICSKFWNQIATVTGTQTGRCCYLVKLAVQSDNTKITML